MDILFIYADGCDDCDRMKKYIEKAIAESGKKIEIKKFDSNTKAAIDIAIKHGIDDLPSCVIGNKIFQGKYFEYEKINEVVKSL